MVGDLGIPFVVRPASVDETPLLNEGAAAYVRRITELKLTAVLEALRATETSYGGVLVADTAVILDGAILGKPKDASDSLAMIRSLSGRAHQVMTSYAVHSLARHETVARVISTDVVMREASLDELVAYAATGEGADKAGAYAIQGRAAFLIKSIAGSYSNVVGLPVCEVVVDMKALGLLEKVL